MHIDIGVVPPGYSEEVILSLPTYKTRYSFRRSVLSSRFPDSLLSEILSNDPSAPEIVLSQPVVTPVVASILYIITERNSHFIPYVDQLKIPLENTDEQSSIRQAAKYLVIPELTLFSNPKILPYLEQNYVSMVDREVNLLSISELEYPEYLEYAMDYGKSTTDPRILYGNNLIEGQLGILQLVASKMKGKINPLEVHINSFRLGQHSFRYDEFVHRNYGRSTSALYYAAGMGHLEIVEWLISLGAKDEKGECLLAYTMVRNDISVKDLLLKSFQYPATILSQYWNNQGDRETERLDHCRHDERFTDRDREEIYDIRLQSMQFLAETIRTGQAEGAEAVKLFDKVHVDMFLVSHQNS